MSATARWSYTNDATIWRQGPRDPVTREPTWGAPTTIKCTFETSGGVQTDDNGQEFVPADTVWHEDPTPISVGDRIVIGESLTDDEPPSRAKTIRKLGTWDMSFFGETPDHAIYTG